MAQRLPVQIWGENVCSGVRYSCECNVLRDGGIRFIPTQGVLIKMKIQMKTAILKYKYLVIGAKKKCNSM